MATIEVYKREIGEPVTRYGSPMKRMQRVVEPLVTLVAFPTVQASRLAVRGHEVTVYRRLDDEQWTSDFASVTRYLSKRVPCKGCGKYKETAFQGYCSTCVAPLRPFEQ